MTFGIGSLASVSSSAFCRPSAERRALGTTLSRNSASALPSMRALEARRRPTASAPSAASFFSSAGVGVAGGVEADARPASASARRRLSARLGRDVGDVRGQAARRRERRSTLDVGGEPGPAPCRPVDEPSANASPSFFSAFGGSSSTNSSTSRFCGVMALMSAAFFVELRHDLVGPRLRRHREAEARAARRGSSARRCARGCGCGRCRRRAR